METNVLARIEWSEFSPTLKAAAVLGGGIALFVALKVGQLMLKLIFGLIGLALVGGAVWWLFIKH